MQTFGILVRVEIEGGPDKGHKAKGAIRGALALGIEQTYRDLFKEGSIVVVTTGALDDGYSARELDRSKTRRRRHEVGACGRGSGPSWSQLY